MRDLRDLEPLRDLCDLDFDLDLDLERGLRALRLGALASCDLTLTVLDFLWGLRRMKPFTW